MSASPSTSTTSCRAAAAPGGAAGGGRSRPLRRRRTAARRGAPSRRPPPASISPRRWSVWAASCRSTSACCAPSCTTWPGCPRQLRVAPRRPATRRRCRALLHTLKGLAATLGVGAHVGCGGPRSNAPWPWPAAPEGLRATVEPALSAIEVAQPRLLDLLQALQAAGAATARSRPPTLPHCSRRCASWPRCWRIRTCAPPKS